MRNWFIPQVGFLMRKLEIYAKYPIAYIQCFAQCNLYSDLTPEVPCGYVLKQLVQSSFFKTVPKSKLCMYVTKEANFGTGTSIFSHLYVT